MSSPTPYAWMADDQSRRDADVKRRSTHSGKQLRNVTVKNSIRVIPRQHEPVVDGEGSTSRARTIMDVNDDANSMRGDDTV